MHQWSIEQKKEEAKRKGRNDLSFSPRGRGERRSPSERTRARDGRRGPPGAEACRSHAGEAAHQRGDAGAAAEERSEDDQRAFAGSPGCAEAGDAREF